MISDNPPLVSEESPPGEDHENCVQQVRSITINPPPDYQTDAWDLVPRLAQHFHNFKYVIGRETCQKGKHHVECAIVEHTDTKNFARSFGNLLELPVKKPCIVHRSHNGSMAMVKLGYAQKENNFVTNIDDVDLLARAREAYAKHASQLSMTNVCKTAAERLTTFDRVKRQRDETLKSYMKRTRLSVQDELARQFADGFLQFEQAIKLGTTPQLMLYHANNRAREEESKKNNPIPHPNTSSSSSRALPSENGGFGAQRVGTQFVFPL